MCDKIKKKQRGGNLDDMMSDINKVSAIKVIHEKKQSDLALILKPFNPEGHKRVKSLNTPLIFEGYNRVNSLKSLIPLG